MPESTCPVCGSTFTPRAANQRYCPPTDDDRARLKGQAVSRCAKRAVNHAARTRQGKTTKPLASPLGQTFDCAQCGKRCVPRQDGVAYQATRFCGYDCKMEWHRTHEDGAMGPARQQVHARTAARKAAVKRLMTWPPKVTVQDVTTYRKALRADPCAYCGEASEASDHIVPRASAGADDWTNRAGACHRCNNMKQSTPLLIFLAYKQTREAFEPWRAIVAEIHTRRKV